MDVRLREATPADVDRLCEVNRAAIETLGSEPYDERQITAWKSGVDPELYPIEAAETHFLVAESDERVVGFGWMKPEADDYLTVDVDGELTGMYVHPNAARNGVGTRLLSALERVARDDSGASLGLWASLNAAPFYRKHGYETMTEQTLEYDDGTELPVEEMRKVL
jgi:putative acetyltransferase